MIFKDIHQILNTGCGIYIYNMETLLLFSQIPTFEILNS